MSRRSTMFAAAAAAALLVSAAVAPAAQAKPIERGQFHDEFTDLVSDFCEEEGLDVSLDFTVDGRFLFNPHGPDGIPHYQETIHVVLVITNLATDEQLTSIERTVSKDQVITDNGDGTFTIEVLATGNATLYDESGKAIARNPGQVRFEILIDNAGTPTDPFDDEFIEFLGETKGSTGRSDDFCTAVPAAFA